MKGKMRIMAIAIIAIGMLLASCSNEGKVMTFDIPSEFEGVYTNGMSDIEIRKDDVLVAGMSYEDYINTSLGGMARVTGFTQSSTGHGRYACNVSATATVDGVTATIVITLNLTLSSDGNTLTFTMTSAYMDPVSVTLTRVQ